MVPTSVLHYGSTDVGAELRERTGGSGPDGCIEAVGQEAHTYGPEYLYDKVKQQLRLENDRPPAIREAIMACRKGGSVFSLGVFAGLVDKFPLGALMNKGLTLRGAQQHGQRYVPMLLDRIARGEISTSHLATHVMSLDEGPHGYDLFKNKEDGCVRAVFQPTGAPTLTRTYCAPDEEGYLNLTVRPLREGVQDLRLSWFALLCRG